MNNTRLIFSGEYTSLWLNETPEFKDAVYEIMLEHFIKCGKLDVNVLSTIDNDKALDYLKKEFDYTAQYTQRRDMIDKTVKEMREYRKNKKK